MFSSKKDTSSRSGLRRRERRRARDAPARGGRRVRGLRTTGAWRVTTWRRSLRASVDRRARRARLRLTGCIPRRPARGRRRPDRPPRRSARGVRGRERFLPTSTRTSFRHRPSPLPSTSPAACARWSAESSRGSTAPSRTTASSSSGSASAPGLRAGAPDLGRERRRLYARPGARDPGLRFTYAPEHLRFFQARFAPLSPFPHLAVEPRRIVVLRVRVALSTELSSSAPSSGAGSGTPLAPSRPSSGAHRRGAAPARASLAKTTTVDRPVWSSSLEPPSTNAAGTPRSVARSTDGPARGARS